MSWLDKLVVGKQELPPRICIFGVHGVGKSSLAAQFPSPIFISTEDGLDQLDVVSFPRPKTINEIVDNIKTLIKEEHEFKTVVIDSIDWMIAPLITSSVEASHDAKELSFGKDQTFVAEEFREVLQGLDVLRRKRNMNVVLLAHAAITRFDDPRNDGYDRYSPAVPKRCAALLQEWVDIMAFAAFKVIIKKSEQGFNKEKSRGITTGERLLHFTEQPAFVAKNRYALPDEADMTFEALSSLVPIVGA